jgi:hypothetical protein
MRKSTCCGVKMPVSLASKTMQCLIRCTSTLRQMTSVTLVFDLKLWRLLKAVAVKAAMELKKLSEREKFKSVLHVHTFYQR